MSKFNLVNENDANEVVEIEAENYESALEEALSKLGWLISMDEDDETSEEMLTIEIEITEFKCEHCNKTFWSIKDNNLCPHCRKECNDDTIGNGKDKYVQMQIKLDREQGFIFVDGEMYDEKI